MSPLFYIIYACLAFNISAIVMLIFIEKAEPSVIAAWVLLFALFPPGGFLLYFFFGSTFEIKLISRHYRLREIERQYSLALSEQIRGIKSREIIFNDPAVEPYRDMVVMNARHAGAIYTQDNNVELFTNGPDKFRRMFKDIENATDCIDVLYFILKARDDIGRKLISLLAEKARSGVKVRLCYDMLGHPTNRFKEFKELIDAGGMVTRYMSSPLKTWMFVNYRMHRKIVIIDNSIAYTGGINVGDDYMGKHKKKNPWRDDAVRITGSAVWLLKLRFLSDWTFVEGQNRGLKRKWKQESPKIEHSHVNAAEDGASEENPGSVGIQIVSSGPDSDFQYVRDSYMKMATSAKKYLYIQSPYYIPGESLHNAIIQAAASGADVKLMIPKVPDFPLLHAASMSWARDLLNSGVGVYVYDGFLHAKAWVIDDVAASVGTANVNLRSFMLNYEVNAVFYDTAFAVSCREAFENDLSSCNELKTDSFSLPVRIFQTFCRLGGPFM